MLLLSAMKISDIKTYVGIKHIPIRNLLPHSSSQDADVFINNSNPGPAYEIKDEKHLKPPVKNIIVIRMLRVYIIA
jgi:hypothetical protein